MTTYNFSVDAELLRELGERLVGRPHIALSELIKNSYDADATIVEIRFEDGEIVVADDGHGMSEEDFATRWMRIGTTRKRSEQRSPRFKRPLTGSKGVGRLSAQILAREITVESRGLMDPTRPAGALAPAIMASINWGAAVREKDLTSVSVNVVPPVHDLPLPDAARHGTVVSLRGLVDEWTEGEFVQLAREIWALRPPFDDESGTGMDIRLVSDVADVEETFATQMGAILELWTARVQGTLLPPGKAPAGVTTILPPQLPSPETDDASEVANSDITRPDRFLQVKVTLKGGDTRVVNYRIPRAPIDSLRYEIRVFKFEKRQPLGISVGEARDYLRRYGGVGIYDEGFRLPYYGVDQDWLNSERDHARRLDRSALVPEALQVRRGLLDLPSNARLFGWVRVSTGHEERAARSIKLPLHEVLSIQVSRDRLTDNAAYQQLRVLVRAGLDLYAMETARQKLAEATSSSEVAPRRPTETIGGLSSAILDTKAYLPAPAFERLDQAAKQTFDSIRLADESSQAYSALLGALATAGSTSLAYEHEISKQVASLVDLATYLETVAVTLPEEAAQKVFSAVERMHDWQQRVAGIRAVFGPLLSKESRDTVERYKARTTAAKVAKDIEPLATGIKVDVSGVPSALYLPAATLPTWTSIFQNLFINAYNALAHSDDPRIEVTGGRGKDRSWLQVSDNGVGVDLATADELWQPFERRLFLSPEKEAAGLGGMGLGLTIVKMIADQVGVGVKFVPPASGMKTSIQIDWMGDR